MKSLLATAVLLFLSTAALAEPAPSAVAVPVTPVTASSLEEDIVKSMFVFCMPPVIKRLDPAAMAVAMHMVEMPPENAVRFDRQGGRVFGVPGYPESILIIAGKNGACSVVAKDFNTDKFWAQVDKVFGKDMPMQLVSEKSIPGGRTKSFEGDYDGATALFISARDAPQAGMLQGVMTFARIGD